MSALLAFWLVRTPGPRADLVDVVWEQSADRLDDYIRGAEHKLPNGGIHRTWQVEHHTMYLHKDEAMADAVGRLVATGVSRENALAQARRDFGWEPPAPGVSGHRYACAHRTLTEGRQALITCTPTSPGAVDAVLAALDVLKEHVR